MTPPEVRSRQGDAIALSEEELARRGVADASDRELLVALLRGWCLAAVVPLVLDRVERDPLRSAGRFPGELLRGLMEVPSGHWSRHPRSHARFLAALRAAAAMRRRLPVDERMRFWTPLDQPALPRSRGAPGDGGDGREH